MIGHAGLARTNAARQADAVHFSALRTHLHEIFAGCRNRMYHG